jgi:hypothetical protein
MTDASRSRRGRSRRLHPDSLVSSQKSASGAKDSLLEMPRYFFTIRGRDRVEDDPDGTYLPDVVAALAYAEYTIRELRKKSSYNNPALIMIVKDQAQQTVLSLPFLPGC